MEVSVGARVDDNLSRDIDFIAKEEKTDKSSIVRRLLTRGVKDELIAFALEKYSKRQISMGRAAEIAKVPLADFMVAATQNKIPMNYSIDSLKQDIRSIRRK